MPEHAFSWKSGTSSSRRLQLLANFGIIPGIAELVVILKPSQIKNTSSSRSLQLLASFGRVPGIALSIPELLVILKPSQVETSLFRLKFYLLCGVRPPFYG